MKKVIIISMMLLGILIAGCGGSAGDKFSGVYTGKIPSTDRNYEMTISSADGKVFNIDVVNDKKVNCLKETATLKDDSLVLNGNEKMTLSGDKTINFRGTTYTKTK